VREALSQVPFMVVCTSVRDKYGRYLADLFYLPDATDPLEVLSDGLCLNRQLLDARLARPYSGRA
jgi:endonuclease YncB( thermonuclease family)